MAKPKPTKNIAADLLLEVASNPDNDKYSVEELAKLHGVDRQLGSEALDGAIVKAIDRRIRLQGYRDWKDPGWAEDVRRSGGIPAGDARWEGSIVTGHQGPPGPGEALAPEWAIRDPSMPKYPASTPVVDEELWANPIVPGSEYGEYGESPGILPGWDKEADSIAHAEDFESYLPKAFADPIHKQRQAGRFMKQLQAYEAAKMDRYYREKEKEEIELDASYSGIKYANRPGGQSYMPASQAEEILKSEAKTSSQPKPKKKQ